MTRYRIDCEIAKDFGEPTKKTYIIDCFEDKSGAEVITDFLRKFDKTTFVSLNIKKEIYDD